MAIGISASLARPGWAMSCADQRPDQHADADFPFGSHLAFLCSPTGQIWKVLLHLLCCFCGVAPLNLFTKTSCSLSHSLNGLALEILHKAMYALPHEVVDLLDAPAEG